MGEIKWDDAPKAGGGGIQWDAPAASSTPAPSGGAYDHPKLKALWMQAGGDAKDADLMAHVALSESSGNPGAAGSYMENGKKRIVKGLWQISDVHGPGQYGDPLVNARKAVELYRSQKLAPWEDSRNKGGGGGWGQYLAQQSASKAQAPSHMQQTRSTAPHQGGELGVHWDDKKPSPPGDVARTPLEQFGAGITTITQSLPGALAEGRLGDLKRMVIDEHNPAKAKEEFGFLSPAMLQRGAKAGSPFAKYLLDNPRLIAPGQLIADLVDPALNLTGKGVSKVAASLLVPGFKYIAGTTAGTYLLNAFSPLRAIASAGGQEAKRAMQALLVKVASAPAQAQHTALKIFGGLDRQAQDDVVHVFQNEQLYVKTRDPHTLGLIQERAKMLADYQNYLTSGQVAGGTLSHGAAEANPLHFGMAGAYKNEKHSDEISQLLDELRGSGHGGKVASEGTERTQAAYKTLHEGQTQAKVPLRDDFSVVNQLERTGTHALKNIAFEGGAAKLPTTLIQRDLPKAGKGLSGPVDGAGHEMIHFTDLPQTLRDQFEFSPSLKNAYMAPALVKYLAKNSTKVFQDEIVKNPTTKTEKAIAAAQGAWSGMNNAARTAIISNPLIHPLWNLSNNSMGAGLSPMEVAPLVARSVFNTLGGGKLLAKYVPRSKEYQKALLDAIHEGAVAEMKIGGKDATRRLASKWSELDTTGKIGKMFDSAQSWNNRLTFGKEGEQAFSVAIYRKLAKSLPDTPEGRAEAAGRVREALGNYQNVAREGPGAGISQVVFFYPWLKGNTPFWARVLATKPQVAYAPADAARVNNQLVNDPSEKQYRARDYEFKHKNADGSFGSYTPLLPARRTNDIIQAVGSGDPQKMVQEGGKILSGIATPPLGAAMDLYGTVKAKPADPRLPQNYQTVFNKSAKPSEKWRQTAAYAAGRAPIPFVGYATRDAIRQGGVKPQDIPGELGGAFLGGFSREDSDPKAYKAEGRAQKALNTQMFRASKIKDDVRRAAAQDRAQAAYDKRVKKYLPGGAKTAPARTTTSKVTWDSAPTGVVWDK